MEACRRSHRPNFRQIDPLGIGLNTPYQKILNQYPVGNDPAYGQDGGLNFSGYRFNAPDNLNEMCLGGKARLQSGRRRQTHSQPCAARSATIPDRSDPRREFPGQAPASIERDNNKGLSARYTAILSPTLVNIFTYGLTSLDENLSGVSGTGFQFEPTALAPLQNWGARARGSTNPLSITCSTM